MLKQSIQLDIFVAREGSLCSDIEKHLTGLMFLLRTLCSIVLNDQPVRLADSKFVSIIVVFYQANCASLNIALLVETIFLFDFPYSEICPL